MIAISGRSPNCTYLQLLRLSLTPGLPRLASRIGAYIDLGAVSVELPSSGERIAFLDARGFNPYFALIEAAWILAGKRDLATPRFAIADFGQYSDDQKTLNGAYGYRLRHYFQEIDQLDLAVHELRNDPGSRRVVLNLYSADDLGKTSADIPCNTQIHFRIIANELEMTVTNRSNDLYFGVPLNWFTFWCVQRLVAGRLGIQAGTQRHVSSCMHLYVQHVEAVRQVIEENKEEELEILEAGMLPFPIDEFLSNHVAISDLHLSDLLSHRLSRYFKSYLSCRDALQPDADLLTTNDAVCRSALDWLRCRREKRAAKTRGENMTQRKTNSDSFALLKLNQWVWDTASSEMISRVERAAQIAAPRLSELLKGTGALYEDADVFVRPGSESRLSKLFILELLTGSLDPALRKSDIGRAYDAKLLEVAGLMGIERSKLTSRELDDSAMRELFGEILNE